MTKEFRKITVRQEGQKGAYVLRRGFQKLKKDGTDAKRKASLSSTFLVVYKNGDYRYYRDNVLARESVSAARVQHETSTQVRRAATASLRDVTLGRV